MWVAFQLIPRTHLLHHNPATLFLSISPATFFTVLESTVLILSRSLTQLEVFARFGNGTFVIMCKSKATCVVQPLQKPKPPILSRSPAPVVETLKRMYPLLAVYTPEMAGDLGKCSRIRHIVRLRQMVQRWRSKALSGRTPADVPAGHVAVCVGTNSRRFVVRATHLNHPIFRKLLRQAEEEYGFANHGPLSIPCEESLFEEILRFLTRNDSWAGPISRPLNLEDFSRCSHLGLRSLDSLIESRPLLADEKSVW